MKNIGGKSGHWLKQIGIESVADIQQRGIANIYVELKLQGHNVSKNMMWALWGAVNEAHWQEIPSSEKERLNLEAERILENS